MSLTTLRYKSQAGVNIFADEEVKNKDLIALADAKLVSGDIVSYSKDSFLFKTENLMLPGFIAENFGFSTSIIGLPIQYEDLSTTFRGSFGTRLDKVIRNQPKFDEIKAAIGLTAKIRELEESDRQNIAEALTSIFNGDIIKNFNITMSTYKDNKGFMYITLSSSANSKEIKEIFEEYMNVVNIENQKWRIKIDHEKFCYCPIESTIGTELSMVIEYINKALKVIKNIISYDIISIIEAQLETGLEEYILEENLMNGIKIDLNSVTYFRNICSPEGKAVFLKNKFGAGYALAYLKQFIEYLPQELDIQKNLDLFEDVVYLEPMIRF